MARIVLDNGAVLDVVWNGKCLLINGDCFPVRDWFVAVFNYSSSDEVIEKFVLDLLKSAGFDVVDVSGVWRV